MLENLMQTPERFFRFLVEKPKGSVVGVSCSPTKCPIAEFIGSYLGPRVSVGAGGLATYSNYAQNRLTLFQTIDTPDWAQAFIIELDRRHRNDSIGRFDKDNVTREEVLEILGSLYPEYAEQEMESDRPTLVHA